MALGLGYHRRWTERLVLFARITSSSTRIIETDQTVSLAAEHKEKIRRFEAFYWHYERQIIAYLRRMLSDEQAAYDLGQEAFMRAWQHFDDISTHNTARAWLYRVVTNLALNLLRQRSARPQTRLDEFLPGQSDPGRRIGEQDLINQILQKLTPKQRSALLLYEVHGLSCDEIGELLGMSRQAIKGALWRAREAFRLEYLREDED